MKEGMVISILMQGPNELGFDDIELPFLSQSGIASCAIFEGHCVDFNPLSLLGGAILVFIFPARSR
jgi:hypothetical protein